MAKKPTMLFAHKQSPISKDEMLEDIESIMQLAPPFSCVKRGSAEIIGNVIEFESEFDGKIQHWTLKLSQRGKK